MNNNYKIIDSHAHSDDEAFDNDRDEVIKTLKENGVVEVLNCASSYNSVKKVLNLVNNNDFMYGALGIHPENADDFTLERLNEIKQLILNNKKIIAVGEIGLDYYWDENPSKEIQLNAFRKQMELASELDIPVIIHDREAHKDTMDIINEFPKVKGIIHCFSGSVEFAKECIKAGYYIGVGGVVTFKNAKKLVKVVEEIPIERILVETDCPYMAPEPNRGKRNQSDYIKYVLDKISNIKHIDELHLNKVVNNNFKTLMKLNK